MKTSLRVNLLLFFCQSSSHLQVGHYRSIILFHKYKFYWILIRDVNKDLTPKDQDKDLTPNDQVKDKDFKYVLKESLRTGRGQGPQLDK